MLQKHQDSASPSLGTLIPSFRNATSSATYLTQMTDKMEVSHLLSADLGRRVLHGPSIPVSNGVPALNSSHLSRDLPYAAHSSFDPSTINHSQHHENQNTYTMHPALVSEDATPLQEFHTVHLSAIEHCMPRAYIRVCLAYRLPTDNNLSSIIEKLNRYARKLVDAKPYLAGYIVPAADCTTRVGLAEIRFTDDDFLNFPQVEVRHFTQTDVPYVYEQLDQKGLPPSVIRPELVSALPEGTDDELAPAFRMQANVVKGGLIVSVYLHHCIADGTGLGFLLTGVVMHDEFAFQRHLDANGFPTPSLNNRLEAFANRKTVVRRQLSWSEPNQISDRRIQCRSLNTTNDTAAKAKSQGRGCIVALSKDKLDQFKTSLQHHSPESFLSANDALQALLWHHMTKARIPSLCMSETRHSKLLIPVNVRNKLREPLPDSYFGAAVDFATAELPLDALSWEGPGTWGRLADIALTIRQAISNVNEAYVRQAIALSLVKDPNIDVRDLMASNMDRAHGADMYITSWEKLGLYDVTFEMGLGCPDWVRKPWSKDPGSCVIMPMDERKPYLEVLIQMTEADMGRLLQDDVFMSYVLRTID